jgi:hypothetical protein
MTDSTKSLKHQDGQKLGRNIKTDKINHARSQPDFGGKIYKQLLGIKIYFPGNQRQVQRKGAICTTTYSRQSTCKRKSIF